MHNTKVQDFANKVGLMFPDTVKRRVILPALLGMAIGNFLGVKIGDEVSPTTAYNDAHLANVARVVSFFNEEMIVDVKMACESAKMMYLVRDRFINGIPTSISASPEFDLMAVVFGFSSIMPVGVYDLLKEAGMTANSAYSMLTMLIMDLKQSNLIQL